MAGVTLEVNIGDILRERKFQVRDKLDDKTVNGYAKKYSSGVDMPPVKIAKVNGTLVLVDGFHRIAALEKIGRPMVKAQIEEADKRQALWMAAKANLEHGLPLKPKESLNVFKAYMRAKRYKHDNGRLKSYREIALELGGLRAYTTIRNWMSKYFPSVASQYGRDEDTGNSKADWTGTTTGISFVKTSVQALDQALAAFRGIESPPERGKVIDHAERIITKMKQGEPWVSPEDNEDY